MGWGVVFPDDSLSDLEEQIVLCYLTINRDVILTRALIQPAGGLHATVVLPYGCMCLQWCLSDCCYQHLVKLLPMEIILLLCIVSMDFNMIEAKNTSIIDVPILDTTLPFEE